MKREYLIWQAQRIALRNARRADQRTQIALGLAVIASVVGGWWVLGQFAPALADWHAVGGSDANLWWLCGGYWAGVATLSVLALRQHGFASKEALVLFMQPLPPAVRFRALFGLIVIELTGWLLVSGSVAAIGLTTTLGWLGMAWLAVALSGGFAIAACSVVCTLLAIRALLGRRTYVALASLVVFATAIAVALRCGLVGWLAPLPVAASMLLLVALLIGPGARWAGRQYEAAFEALQSQSQRLRVAYFPGVRTLAAMLAQRRTLTAALLCRALLRQSRSPFMWLRIGAVGLYTLPFPWVRAALTPYNLPDTFLIVGYTAALFALIMIDSAASPIGGEGNRLSLLLTAPITLNGLVHAKLVMQLAAILPTTVLIGSALSAWVGLSWLSYLQVLAAITLLVVGTTAWFVCGSAWDADLALEVEGAIQALVLEEAPITPRRLVLAAIGLLLGAGQLLVVWALPSVQALLALALLNLLLLVGMLRFAVVQLQRLQQA